MPCSKPRPFPPHVLALQIGNQAAHIIRRTQALLRLTQLSVKGLKKFHEAIEHAVKIPLRSNPAKISNQFTWPPAGRADTIPATTPRYTFRAPGAAVFRRHSQLASRRQIRFRMECRYVSQPNTRHSLLKAGSFFHELFSCPGRLFWVPDRIQCPRARAPIEKFLGIRRVILAKTALRGQ